LWGALAPCSIDPLHFISVGLVISLKVKVIHNQQKLRWPYLIVDCSVDVLPEISSADPSVADYTLDVKMRLRCQSTPIVHTLETSRPKPRMIEFCAEEIAHKQTELVLQEMEIFARIHGYTLQLM
jgi:hypothetical protein